MLTVVVSRQSSEPTALVLLYPRNVPIVVREFLSNVCCASREQDKHIPDKTTQTMHFSFSSKKKSVSFRFFLYSFATLEIIQTKSIESICTMSIQYFEMDFQKKKKLMRNEWISIF